MKTRASQNGRPHWHEILIKERVEIRERLSLNALGEALLPDGVAEEDAAPLLHEQYISEKAGQIDAGRLREIEEALERLACDAYGTCEECGEEIAQKRLLAVPWARFCVHCQERLAHPGAFQDNEFATF
jgi:DnaK suppressor protein